MANGIVSNFLSPKAFRLVISATNEDVLKGIRISKVLIKLTSTPLRHMQEDGATIVDSRIILPSSMSVDLFCENFDDLSKVNDIVSDRSNFYSATSKGITIDQLMVDSDQTKQSPEIISAHAIRISFKQVLIKNTKPIIFSQSADSSTINRGMTLLESAKSSISDLFNLVVK